MSMIFPVKKVFCSLFDLIILEFYCSILGMKATEEFKSLTLSYSNDQTKLRLNLIDDKIDHAVAYGRLAIGVAQPFLQVASDKVKQSGDTVLTPLISLPTPGKATVEVLILADCEGFEICLVGIDAFLELAKPFHGADKIDWEQRIEMGTNETDF